MLESGALPTIGISVYAGASEKQLGQCPSTELRKGEAGEKLKIALAEIMPATRVPWPLLSSLEQPIPSLMKSSQPITDPSRLKCGKSGRSPLSMTATIT